MNEYSRLKWWPIVHQEGIGGNPTLEVWSLSFSPAAVSHIVLFSEKEVLVDRTTLSTKITPSTCHEPTIDLQTLCTWVQHCTWRCRYSTYSVWHSWSAFQTTVWDGDRLSWTTSSLGGNVSISLRENIYTQVWRDHPLTLRRFIQARVSGENWLCEWFWV